MRKPYGTKLARGRHEIVLGVPGSGKSTLARELVRDARRVVFFDPHGDYTDMRGATCIAPAELTIERLSEPFCRIVCLAERSDEYDVTDEFVYVARVCREARDFGGVVLLADEVGDYNGGRALKALKSLFRNGHKDGIVTVLVSQRAVDIPLGCRSTATRVTSLLQDNEDDLEALRMYSDPPGGDSFPTAARAWEPGDPPVIWQRKELWPRY